MKKILLFPAVCFSALTLAQYTVSGMVVDEATQKSLQGVMIAAQNMNTIMNTDHKGQFNFSINDIKLKLIISKKGYESQELDMALPLTQPLLIALASKVTDIDEVALSTGYQKIPKERATGSFSAVDSKLLNQQVGINILERLVLVGNGLTIDKGTSSSTSQLMVRGLSTISGPRSPLIVVDNFPYEGDIKNINPNIVENITILKDAAASSIWGARAANGVIVITTKNAKINQPISIELTTTTSVSGKPDLGYLRPISSTDFIEMEQELFKRGYYNSDINSSSHPIISPVVELLNREKKGLISSDEVARQLAFLKTIDSRDQFKKYMYLPMENRQYFLSLGGGAQKFSWISSFGYDDNSGNLGETYKRLNVRFQNTWRPTDRLSINTGIYYTDTRTQSGRLGYGSISMKNNNALPYMQMADANGNALPVNYIYDQAYKNSMTKYALLDWNYYPLTDWQYDTQKVNTTELIGNAAVKYKIIKDLEAEVKYQYQRQNGESNSLHGEQSIFARNYINRFAKVNTDGSVSFVIPKGGILDKSNSLTEVHNMRGQLSYNNQWGRHGVSMIAGGETRDSKTTSNSNRYYGYNANTLATGSVDFTNSYPLLASGGSEYIQRGQSLSERNTRFVSLFANASYNYDDRYIISGSVRRDASNLFGLKTNDQWNPFWSTGLAWNIAKENFYEVNWLPQLKLRGSYGFNGNINPAMVAVSTIAYDPTNSVYTNTKMARFDNYYNPSLRWETSRMINFGLDFSTKNKRLSGSVEYFTKKGTDLFGRSILDYTTGISSITANVASTKGKGWDVELQSLNIDKGLKWSSILNFSTFKDQVIQYNLTNTMALQYIGSNDGVPITGITGLPVYSIFAFKWAGLDPVTGDPQGYLDGKVSKDYAKLVGPGTKLEDLEYFGSAVPTIYGSFINSFSYRRLSLDIGLTYKFGYWFRRTSIQYTNLFNSWQGHSDYAQRWQKPGDEAYTNVPSTNFQNNTNRDVFYAGSSVLIEKGDHIRLQYINLSYQFDTKNNNILRDFCLFVNASNLGILWRAAKTGIDPDYNIGFNNLRPTAIYSIGLRAKF